MLFNKYLKILRKWCLVFFFRHKVLEILKTKNDIFDFEIFENTIKKSIA